MSDWPNARPPAQLSETALADHVAYAISAPPRAALTIGFIIAVIVMGIVTIQAAAFTSQSYKKRKYTVILVNVLVIYNCISLALLGDGLYRSMVTMFRDFNPNGALLARRYLLLALPNFISRTISSYAFAALTSSFSRSGLLGAALNLFVASRIVMAGFGLQSLWARSGANATSTLTNRELPSYVTRIVLVGAISECVICGLFCAAIFRLALTGARHELDLGRMTQYVIPACLVTMIWHLSFALGVWHHSSFWAACFGLPLGAISNATLLALLHAHPATLAVPFWKQRTTAKRHPSTAKARISIAQDISTTSCHDGPLEAQLMERLERQFPQEEESRSYYLELAVPDSETGEAHQPPG